MKKRGNNMAKILAVTAEYVSIGMDNGELRDAPISVFNFVPQVGDEVEVFESGQKIIISKIEKTTTQTYPQQPYYQQPYPQQQAQQMPNIIINNANNNVNTNKNYNGMGMGRPKNKWVAIILCLLLGCFGAHKFYEGKTGMGILYLFTGGLCFIGVIVDVIVLLGKPATYYV